VSLVVLFLAGAAVGRGQGVGRLGGEFSIAGLIPNDQVLPAVSLTTNGGAVAFYNQGQGIYGAVLGGGYTGSTIFSVNKTAKGDQVRPAVRVLRNGITIFVWQSSVQGSSDIFARLARGTNFFTPEIRVNTYMKDQQVEPAVAALPDGGAMITWASYGEDGSGWGVYARKVTASGALAGAQEFLVNQYTVGNQRRPAVCTLAGGNVVFAWVSDQERFAMSSDVYARVFSGAGVPVTAEFLVNSATNKCSFPALAPLNNGGFTAAWSQKDAIPTNGLDVWGRAFNAHGAPTVPAFRLNTLLFGDQYNPRLASGPNGVLAVWTSLGEDGDREGVYGRFLLGGNQVSGDEFLVNTTTVSQQMEPDVAWNGVDRFLVVWTSFVGTTGFDLFGQMYILNP
jgi:hypothetical protein